MTIEYDRDTNVLDIDFEAGIYKTDAYDDHGLVLRRDPYDNRIKGLLIHLGTALGKEERKPAVGLTEEDVRRIVRETIAMSNPMVGGSD